MIVSHARCISQQGNGSVLSERSKVVDYITEIVSKKSLSQIELAALIGVDRSMVTRYLAGTSEPGSLSCLLLAALTDNQEAKGYFVEASKLTNKQFELMGEVLGVKSGVQSGDERALLNWWRKPNDPMEAAMKTAIEKLLDLRTK